jgi:hypothetical protein
MAIADLFLIFSGRGILEAGLILRQFQGSRIAESYSEMIFVLAVKLYFVVFCFVLFLT